MILVEDVSVERAAGHRLIVRHRGTPRHKICAVGELDLAAREDLDRALRAGGRGRTLELDLSQTTFLDCSCLSVLVAAHHRLLKDHGRLVITGLDDAVARVIRITRMDQTLFIVPAGQDSFDSLSRSARPAGRPPRMPMQQQAHS